VAILLALILVGKALAGGAAVLALGYPVRIAAIVGVSLAQIGEFSFVLLRQGLAQGLIAPEVYRRFLAAAIVTMLATPFLSAASHGLGRRMAGSPAPADAPGVPALPLREHVLVVGFGHMGETVARLLARAGVPFRVVDLDPDRVRRGRKRGVAIEYGDATNDAVLRRAGIEGAVAAVVVLADLRSTRQVVRHCRTLHPGLFVLARTRYLADIPALAAAGADEVVAEEFESSLEIAGRTLQRLGLPLPWVEAETAEIRQSRQEGFRKFREPGR
jgi:CPA2 family monovalent cation:H+ antiporter-2